jgi:hypothetical protein
MYSIIRDLLTAVLGDRALPFRILTGISERRVKPGADGVDVGLCETGDLAAVLGKVAHRWHPRRGAIG